MNYNYWTIPTKDGWQIQCGGDDLRVLKFTRRRDARVFETLDGLISQHFKGGSCGFAVRFDDVSSAGYAPMNYERADVCGPGAGNAVQPVVRRKFIGETAAKVIRLADIYRIPQGVVPLPTEDINASHLIEGDVTDAVVLEFVCRASGPSPK